ncbi:nickel pincer cofactor biosynthesis protein LarC [bacterium]|nr:nickel pincer cofactor biosynthesis protein LarC [bacterium]
MRTAYFDPFSGASGDMILGALLDAGLDLDALRAELATLPLHGYHIEAEKVTRHGIAATKCDVVLDHHHHDDDHGGHHHHEHRGLSDVLAVIDGSTLPDADKERAGAVFRRLAAAEAKVHACSVEDIHFHEVGAVDAIVDIVGAVVGLRLLGVEQVASGPLRTGTGFVQCAHGRLPVPAPATAELLGGFPSVGTDLEGELTTPTGAALLTTLADVFGPRPPMTLDAIGYGAGTRESESVPNLLRACLGDATPFGADGTESDQVLVLEANLDDLSPEIAGHAIERLLDAGALDAFLTPIQMKKSRPGVLLSVIAQPQDAAALEDIILRETSTFGLRRTPASRRKLRREWVEAATPYGTVRVKLGRIGDDIVQAAPEYEDCRRAAAEHHVPLKAVYQAALDAFRAATEA